MEPQGAPQSHPRSCQGRAPPRTHPGQGRTARVLWAQGQELLPRPQEGPQLLPQILVLPLLGWGTEMGRWGQLCLGRRWGEGVGLVGPGRGVWWGLGVGREVWQGWGVGSGAWVLAGPGCAGGLMGLRCGVWRGPGVGCGVWQGMGSGGAGAWCSPDSGSPAPAGGRTALQAPGECPGAGGGLPWARLRPLCPGSGVGMGRAGARSWALPHAGKPSALARGWSAGPSPTPAWRPSVLVSSLLGLAASVAAARRPHL